jgi:hypothetical protein
MPFKTETQNLVQILPTNQGAEVKREEDDIEAQISRQEASAATRKMADTYAKPCSVPNCKCQNFQQVAGSARCNRAGCDHLESEHK